MLSQVAIWALFWSVLIQKEITINMVDQYYYFFFFFFWGGGASAVPRLEPPLLRNGIIFSPTVTYWRLVIIIISCMASCNSTSWRPIINRLQKTSCHIDNNERLIRVVTSFAFAWVVWDTSMLVNFSQRVKKLSEFWVGACIHERIETRVGVARTPTTWAPAM